MAFSRDIADFSKFIDAPGRKISRPPSSLFNKENNNFHDVLKDMLVPVQGASAPLSATAVLNKEQLMLFTRALQIQMNAHLYNSIFNNALESNALALKVMRDYGNTKTYQIPDASRSGRETPEKILSEADDTINQIVNQAARKYGVDAGLIRSVIKAESNFNPSATSPAGAMGLMQLMPGTAKELGINNAYDPGENIMGGTRYLKMLLDRYDGQVDLALAAYNWGMGNLERDPDHLPDETLTYIEKVNSYFKSMQG